MKTTRLALALLAVGSPGFISGCRTEVVTPVVVSRIVVDPVEASILQGEDVRFTATVIDEFDQVMARAVVTWSTVEPSIAPVSLDGWVLGVSPGTTTVRASFNGTVGSALITVTADPECGRDDLIPASSSKKDKKKKKGENDDDEGEDDCSPPADPIRP